ncbi:MAG: GatB/YqeY domain-containing protein [Nitrospirae bacterium]|nr:GatB/YqeY domain-containing protein [Nitrospirota bacterium]
MAIKARLDQSLTAALKSGDSLKASTIRLLKAGIKNREIEKRGELTDDEVIGLVSSAVKQRKDSIEQFARGGREDLVRKETQEMEFLMTFLPEPFSPEALDQEIRGAIAEAGASGIQDMGKVMKALMPRIKGRADGAAVQSRVRDLLQQTPSR